MDMRKYVFLAVTLSVFTSVLFSQTKEKGSVYFGWGYNRD